MIRSVARHACTLAGFLAVTGCVDDVPSTPEPLASEPSALRAARGGGSEVWVVDQSNSTGLGYGGKLHIFSAADLTGGNPAAATSDQIDLAGPTAALCMSSTAANPVRPHMLLFNASQSHAILSFVGSGHVVIFDAAARKPVACLRASAGAGGARQAHAAFPSPDGSYILVANQNGKLLERIDSHFASNTFSFNPAATIDLAGCTTPTGAPCQSPVLRPDNAPICPIVGNNRGRAWITLRGGGLFVVDPTQTPMQIVAEYDRATIHPNGCGGIAAGGRMFINSGGGTAGNHTEFDVYSFPIAGYRAGNPANSPAPSLIFSDDVDHRDSHGMTVAHGNLWVFDRGANVAEVFAPASGTHIGTVQLAGSVSADPTPDLADTSVGGSHIFVSLRGPNPLTGDPHVATGSTPGVGVIEVAANGHTGVLTGIAPIANLDGAAVERADPHGIRVRRR